MKIQNLFEICKDYDADCFDIKNKQHCYEYRPDRGFCPFLKIKIDMDGIKITPEETYQKLEESLFEI